MRQSRRTRRRPADGDPAGRALSLLEDYDEQSASTQDVPLPHCVSSWHLGDASPGVSQYPPGPQTVAVVQVQQSELERQLARQAPSTQVWPALQLVFDRQLGCGRTSGITDPCRAHVVRAAVGVVDTVAVTEAVDAAVTYRRTRDVEHARAAPGRARLADARGADIARSAIRSRLAPRLAETVGAPPTHAALTAEVAERLSGRQRLTGPRHATGARAAIARGFARVRGRAARARRSAAAAALPALTSAAAGAAHTDGSARASSAPLPPPVPTTPPVPITPPVPTVPPVPGASPPVPELGDAACTRIAMAGMPADSARAAGMPAGRRGRDDALAVLLVADRALGAVGVAITVGVRRTAPAVATGIRHGDAACASESADRNHGETDEKVKACHEVLLLPSGTSQATGHMVPPLADLKTI